MKKAVVLGLVALLVIGSSVAVYARAQKLDLIEDPVPMEADQSGTVAGFAILNNPDPADDGYNLTVVVSLKEGDTATTYRVFLEEYDMSGWVGYIEIGSLTTNRRGKGNVKINLTLPLDEEHPTGTYCLQVAVGAGWDFATKAVQITLK